MALAAYVLPVINDLPWPPYRLRPRVVFDEAAVLHALRNNPPSGTLGRTLSRLAANALIRNAAASINVANAPELTKLLNL